MKGHLVCFLLLAATFAAATEWDDDVPGLHVKGQQEQQTPEPPTDPTQKLQKTVPPTYGKCPPSPHIVPNAYYCMTGRPCPGDEKCCQVQNIVKCVLPKGVHQGYCPRPRDQAVYKKPCAEDHQCGWHEKCCLKDGQKKCVQAVPVAPGLCPKRQVPQDITPCRDECEEDVTCGSGKKCCFHRCGLKCVDPERPHPGKSQEQEEEQEHGQEAGICRLPKKMGPCRVPMPRWFYNGHTGRCEGFIYGGCQGNANNFETLEECELRCVLPDIRKPGTCPPPVQDEDKPCGKYCSSDAKCPGIERCCPTSCGQECRIPQRYMPGYCPAVLLPPSRRDVCFPTCTKDFDCNHGVQLPLKKCCDFEGRKICVDHVEEHPGVCLRKVEVQPFVPCNDTCDDDQDCPLTEKCCFTGCGRGCLPSVRSEVCQLPMAQGSCKKSLTRFYYDPEKKKCVSFIYRDCEGNRNNFKTKELCEKVCGEISKEVCRLPKETGPCQAFSIQYYHNWETKRCETFPYGLCGGNENRFSTKLECEMVCGGFDQQQEQQQEHPRH